jgi:hypothetical protein
VCTSFRIWVFMDILLRDKKVVSVVLCVFVRHSLSKLIEKTA